MVHVNFSAIMWHLPLKTEQHPLNPFTEKQLYDILALLFGYVFLDRDETQSFTIRALTAQAASGLAELIKVNVTEISLGAWIKKLVDGIQKDGFLDSYGNTLIRRLLAEGMSIDEVVWVIIPTAAAGTANQGQQVATPPPPPASISLGSILIAVCSNARLVPLGQVQGRLG
jgi:linoleate 8R-lipoxygenase / 9,12-octadecadienoate 8-hydroperoxide 8R-isomerase